MADTSIVNFKGIGELAKPATKLIEKVSSCVGIVYEPTRIRRRAKAEADAAEIEVRSRITVDRLLAQAEIENRELGERAIKRLVQEETRSQQNMEDVLEGATRYLNEDAEPEKIDDDWLTRFFRECRTVSNKEVQDLWSKILAGEANRAGSFTRRTLAFVSTVSKKEAQAFARLCRFVWIVEGDRIPLIVNVDSDIYRDNGLRFTTLKNLDSIGLIHFDPVSAFSRQNLPATVAVSHCGNSYRLTPPKGAVATISVGTALFTPMGQELAQVVEAEPRGGVQECGMDYWRSLGWTLEGIQPSN